MAHAAPAHPHRHGTQRPDGYDAELCASAARAFAIELMRSLRQRAKKQLGLGSVQDAFTGAVVAASSGPMEAWVAWW